MSWLAWVGIALSVLVVVYIGWVVYIVRGYNPETDYSGDGGLAVIALILLPFWPLLRLYIRLADFFSRKRES